MRSTNTSSSNYGIVMSAVGLWAERATIRTLWTSWLCTKDSGTLTMRLRYAEGRLCQGSSCSAENAGSWLGDGLLALHSGSDDGTHRKPGFSNGIPSVIY